MSTTSDATLVWWLVAWRDLEIITDVELLGDSVLRPLLLPLLERGCFVVMLCMEVVCLRDHLKEMSCSGCVITSHSSSSQNRMNGKLIIHSPNLRERERTGGGGLITPNHTSITEGKGQFFAKQTKTDGRRDC